MSEFNGTPGEWDSSYWVVYSTTPDGKIDKVIAYLGTNKERRTEENKANAKLMGASKDLLTACQAALARIESDIEGRRKTDEGNACRDAIAKALGTSK
jgi:hypothetical protein